MKDEMRDCDEDWNDDNDSLEGGFGQATNTTRLLHEPAASRLIGAYSALCRFTLYYVRKYISYC